MRTLGYTAVGSILERGNMEIMLTSKTYELTEELKSFLHSKLERLAKYASLQIERVEVIVDKVKRHAHANTQARVDIQLHRAGERMNFLEEGENVKQAFYNAYEALEHRLDKELDEKKQNHE